MKINAFITGSRIYGVPRADSDLDLVILTDEATAAELEKHAIIGGAHDSCHSLYFDALNLIVLTNEQEFEAWRTFTEQAIREMPVTRERAIEIRKQYVPYPNVEE